MNSGKLPKFVHGGDIYSASSPTGYWLDFSANINPLGLAASVQEAIAANIASVVHYPDPQGRALKGAIAARYGVAAASVVLGNGAAELFYVYFHAKRPRRVLVPVPSFSEYERASLCVGAEVKYLFLQEKEQFKLDLVELKQEMLDCDTVVLGNPNNPTGGLLKKEDLAGVIYLAEEKGIDVIIDESFLDFRQDRTLYSVMDWVAKYPHLLVISSLTKFFALPGIRLGYAIASEDMAKKLDAHKDVWNVNSLAQAAGVAALADEAYQVATLENTQKNMAQMCEGLRSIAEASGLVSYPPSVNFVLLNLAGCGMTSGELVAAMKEKGILIRDCSNYEGLDDRFVRLAIRSTEENQVMLEALRECVMK